MITLGFSAFEVTFAIFLKQRFGYHQREASYAFAFIGVCMVVAQGVLVRRLVPRLGEPRLMMVGTALMTGGLAVLSWSHSELELFLSLAMVAVGGWFCDRDRLRNSQRQPRQPLAREERRARDRHLRLRVGNQRTGRRSRRPDREPGDPPGCS